jgi:hypothetical protein
MIQPNIQLNFLAIGLAVLASFMVGFLWYSFLFGKAWQKEMGYTEKMEIDKKMMIKSLVLNIIGTFLMVWVFSHNIAAWDPKTWGINKSFMPPVGAALSSAIFTWLGFYVPQDLNKVSFHMRSWKLFFIETSHNLVSLLVAAFILVLMK